MNLCDTCQLHMWQHVVLQLSRAAKLCLHQAVVQIRLLIGPMLRLEALLRFLDVRVLEVEAVRAIGRTLDHRIRDLALVVLTCTMVNTKSELHIYTYQAASRHVSHRR